MPEARGAPCSLRSSLSAVSLTSVRSPFLSPSIPIPIVFVQVYKFWCYYWGLCLLTGAPRGAPEAAPLRPLFPPLAPSLSPAFPRLSSMYQYNLVGARRSFAFLCFLAGRRCCRCPAAQSPPRRRYTPRRRSSPFSSVDALPTPWKPPCLFSLSDLPFAKRTSNYAANDKYLPRPLLAAAATQTRTAEPFDLEALTARVIRGPELPTRGCEMQPVFLDASVAG